MGQVVFLLSSTMDQALIKLSNGSGDIGMMLLMNYAAHIVI